MQRVGPKQNIVVKVDEADVDDDWESEEPFYRLQAAKALKHAQSKAEGADDQGQSLDKKKIKKYKKAEGTGDETGEGKNKLREHVTDADQEKAAMQIQKAAEVKGKKKRKAKDPNKDQGEQTGKLAEAARQRQPVSPERDKNLAKGGKDGAAKV